jgi:hypothetical protein
VCAVSGIDCSHAGSLWVHDMIHTGERYCVCVSFVGKDLLLAVN